MLPHAVKSHRPENNKHKYHKPCFGSQRHFYRHLNISVKLWLSVIHLLTVVCLLIVHLLTIVCLLIVHLLTIVHLLSVHILTIIGLLIFSIYRLLKLICIRLIAFTHIISAIRAEFRAVRHIIFMTLPASSPSPGSNVFIFSTASSR